LSALNRPTAAGFVCSTSSTIIAAFVRVRLLMCLFVFIPGVQVARFLNDLALRVGQPEEIVLDNGPEGTSEAMFDLSERTGVHLGLIDVEPESPSRTPS